MFQQVSLDFFLSVLQNIAAIETKQNREDLLSSWAFYNCRFPLLVNFCPEVLKFRKASFITFLLLAETFCCPVSLISEPSNFEFLFLIRPAYSFYILLDELLRKHLDKHGWFEGLSSPWKNIGTTCFYYLSKY